VKYGRCPEKQAHDGRIDALESARIDAQAAADQAQGCAEARCQADAQQHLEQIVDPRRALDQGRAGEQQHEDDEVRGGLEDGARDHQVEWLDLGIEQQPLVRIDGGQTT
jgi:hypothetical protein